MYATVSVGQSEHSRTAYSNNSARHCGQEFSISAEIQVCVFIVAFTIEIVT